MTAIISDRERISILTTGGTIEKTYDEADGTLQNRGSVVERILERLRLPGLEVSRRSLTAKDSLDLTEPERRAIVDAILDEAGRAAVVVLHGTDTLEQTGRLLAAPGREPPPHPVVLTGAMRPFGYENSDAVQNLCEAIGAARRLERGCFVAFHGRLLPLPNVTKDRRRGCFVAC